MLFLLFGVPLMALGIVLGADLCYGLVCAAFEWVAKLADKIPAGHLGDKLRELGLLKVWFIVLISLCLLSPYLK